MATTFQWSGKNVRGMIESGEMVASSKEEVMEHLRRRNIVPTAITEKKRSRSITLFGGKVKEKDIVVFTRQFATMIDAGLPLVQALEILSTQVENKTFGHVISQVKDDVEGGSTFADALRKHPKVFNELYVNMVAAGEAGGILDTILARLSTYIEKAMKLKKKVKSAMVYPSVVSAVAVIVIGIIMVFVVPTFSKMYAGAGMVLPLPTRIVIDISNFLSGIGGLIVLGSIIAFIVFIIQLRRTDKGRYFTDKILLKAPVFGNIILKAAIAKFTRTLGTLTSSGVPILDGLEITAKTAGNKVLEKAIYEVRTAVAEGKTISDPLMKAKVFPPMVNHMIAVGEATGALDAMLGKIADFYDDEVDAAVSTLTSLIEPFLMVFLGGTVGFIIVAMYLPIFKMGELIK
ncbi:MAG TPA: type II secretion system F family protein [Nitrospirae bacterium]|nr:type II secretion system F family protein [Nitrospirota bacterium]